MKEINLRFDGISPLLLHNNQTVDPLNIYSKATKSITSKGKNKTDQDCLDLSRIEWEAGLYFDAEGFISIPSQNIKAMVANAGKRTKNGKNVKQGILVDGLYCRLKFPGDKIRLDKPPRTPDEVPSKCLDPLFEKHFDRRIAKNKASSIVRTRPRFDEWSLCCTILFQEEILNERTILEIIQTAGKYDGLGDYRERYGHFEPVVLK